MKIDLKKYKKRLKAMTPDKTDFFIWFISLITGALAYDLKLYALLGVSSWLFLGNMCYCIFWLIDSCIYYVLKKKEDKKKNEHLGS